MENSKVLAVDVLKNENFENMTLKMKDSVWYAISQPESPIGTLDSAGVREILNFAENEKRKTEKTSRAMFKVSYAVTETGVEFLIESATKTRVSEPTNKPFASLLKLAEAPANGKIIRHDSGDWFVQKNGSGVLALFSTTEQVVTLANGDVHRARITLKESEYDYNKESDLLKLTDRMRSLALDGKLSSWKIKPI